MFRSTLIASIAVLALVVGAFVGLPGESWASSNADGPQPWGTWVWRTQVGPGADIPVMLTLHQDGTINASDGTMFGFGGLLGPPNKQTPLYGLWERTGAKSIAGTQMWLIFNPDGLLIAFGRTSGELVFTDRDHLQGTIRPKYLPCPTPFTCPDPITSPESAWIPFAPDPFTVTATRLKMVRP